MSIDSKPGKPKGSEELRRPSDMHCKQSHCCVYCNNNIDSVNLKRCGQCRAVNYCSRKCQKHHWKDHQKICDAIHNLSSQQQKEVEMKGQYQAQLTPNEQRKLVSLIGEQTIVKLFLNNQYKSKHVDILWDTGANISLISKDYLYYLFPNIVIRNLEDILSEADKLHVKWGNQQDVPYEGYAELEVSFSSNMDKNVLVPFLVTSQKLQHPILGTNAIKHISKGYHPDELSYYLQQCLEDTSNGTIESLVNFINAEKQQELSYVKTPKTYTVIPAGSQTKIKCNIERQIFEKSIPTAFEPDVQEIEDIAPIPTILSSRQGIQSYVKIPIVNRTHHDMTLPPNTIIGSISQVQSITPIEPVNITPEKEKQILEQHQEKVNQQPTSLHSDDNYSENHQRRKEEIHMDREAGSREEGKTQRVLNDLDLSNLSQDEREVVKELITGNIDVFCADENYDIGNVTDCKMKINLKDKVPVQKTYYSMPKPLHQEVKNHVEDLLNKGWITKSCSNYSSPVVAVRKKCGGLRLCVDYRALNKKTVLDRHPLPRVQDAIDSLNGKKWFSLLDQQKAYHQIYLDPESRPLTAFITPWGLYEWVRVPFGLSNAPAVFQRYMEKCFFDIRDKFAFPYLDDVLVYSDDFTSHISHLRKVFSILREHGIKVKAKKCRLFQKQINYLGRTISDKGYGIDKNNIKAVTDLATKTPSNIGQLRQVLGLLGYYRRYIQGFAKIAQPLFDLLKKENIKTNQKGIKSSTLITWNDQHQYALETLIAAITSPPLLSYPDFDLPFTLHADASKKGLGAGLYQFKDNKMRILGFGSRSLRKTEQGYHSSKLEFLSLKWAVCEQFRDYLVYAKEVHVFTDNNPLLYVLSSAKLNATSQR